MAIPRITNFSRVFEDDEIDPMITAAAPAARFDMLVRLAERIRTVCETPYASCALASDFGSAFRYAAQRHNLGTRGFTGRYARSPGDSGSAADTEALSSSSGSTSESRITTPSSGGGSDEWPPTGDSYTLTTASVWDLSPTESIDRAFQAAEALAPATEVFQIKNAVSFAAVPIQVEDLETI